MVSQTEWKVVFAHSGNECAFPGCDAPVVEPGDSGDPSVVFAEVCHIVGDSHQGPRGRGEMSDADRDLAANLVLFCGQHHKLVDKRPEVYSVGVLRQMKEDHEARFRRKPIDSTRSGPVLVEDTLYSSVLPVVTLPATVYSAPCLVDVDDERDLVPLADWKRSGHANHPFLLRDGRVSAFTDLSRADQPFHALVDRDAVDGHKAMGMWDDPEGHRRYMTLMNKGLRRRLTLRGLRYDPGHWRFWFPCLKPGENREITYKTKTGRSQKRDVVHQQVRRATGEPTGVYWHTAVGLHFDRVAGSQWCVTIRPEFHLTSDGETPLDPSKIGRKVTRKKSNMHNEEFLNELHFWRWWLADGSPRLNVRVGSQTLAVGTDLVTATVRWPGVPNDTKAYTNDVFADQLFSLERLAAEGSEAGFDIDDEDEDLDEGWDDEDDEGAGE